MMFAVRTAERQQRFPGERTIAATVRTLATYLRS